MAVVVGTGGLGTAVARRLGQSHRLLVADRDEAHVRRKCQTLAAEGHDVAPFACDVTEDAQVVALVGEAERRGRVRTLVNVVGLSPAAGDFRRIMRVNIVGAARVVSSFASVLEPGGAAVLISSSAAYMRAPTRDLLPILDEPLAPGFVEEAERALGPGADAAAAYVVSKVALNRLCVREAPAWGSRGLRIVSLSPGLIATPQGAESYGHSGGKLGLFEAVPLGRECSMIEIAGVVAFLASDGASYITGTDILVDGGLISAVAAR